MVLHYTALPQREIWSDWQQVHHFTALLQRPKCLHHRYQAFTKIPKRKNTPEWVSNAHSANAPVEGVLKSLKKKKAIV